jgi:hypothetical protein
MKDESSELIIHASEQFLTAERAAHMQVRDVCFGKGVFRRGKVLPAKHQTPRRAASQRGANGVQSAAVGA